MIRSSIRNEVQQRGNDDGTIVLAADMNTWIDLAVRALWYAYPWPFKSVEDSTLNTTAFSKSLTLPAGLQELKKVINTTMTGVLQPRNERFIQSLFPDDTQYAPPLFYCDGGFVQAANQTGPPQRKIHLYPVPDRVYPIQIRYQKLPALPGSQSSPDSAYGPFPEDFDEAIIQWCLIRFFRKVGDIAQANLAQSAFNAELQRMIAIYSTMTETFPMVDSELESNFGTFGTGLWGFS